MTDEQIFSAVTTAASVIIGGVITWAVAWYYYKRAGDELRHEAARLNRSTEIILRWLENRGVDVSVIRDRDGIPTGLNLSASVNESAHATDSSDATITKAGGHTKK